MNNSSKIFLFVSCFSTCYGLEVQPWLTDPYEFRSDVGFSYSYFQKVQGSVKNKSYPSNNYLTYAGFGFMPSEDWDIDFDIEMARTPRQNYSFRSGALQCRYRFLNDIAADPVSLVLGANIRGVGSKSVKDISSPYASYVDFELTASVGKEKTCNESWSLRGFGFTALGMGITGYPWVRALGSFEGSSGDRHRGGVSVEGYFGLAGKNYVNVSHFRGWGRVQHSSIDTGAFYAYKMGLWGELLFSYSIRAFAHNYPQYEQRATIQYQIPFSLL